jgi:hypothetical protein
MELKELDIPLERDVFLRSLLRELSGVLEDVVGLKEAAGFVSVVGQTIGNWINTEYKNALQVLNLSRASSSRMCGSKTPNSGKILCDRGKRREDRLWQYSVPFCRQSYW